MAGITGMRLTISILNLVGSSLSALGAGFICICYLFLPLKAHFRHRLIQSLALADFLNATSDSASGFYILVRNHELPEGIGCRINGLVTQITVQATDLSILAIAIVTFWVVTRPRTFGAWSTRKGILAVCFIWVLPFITGFTALGKGWYHPVSGNWCWIQKEPAYLRYALTHGWRFFVILSVTVMHIYLHFFLRKHYPPMSGGVLTACPRKSHIVDEKDENEDEVVTRELPTKLHHSNSSQSDPSSHLAKDVNIHVKTTMEVSEEHPRRQSQQGQSSSCPQPVAVVSTVTGTPRKTRTQKTSYQDPDCGKKIKKVLLMRAYPTFYVILLIPGITNRLVEACGGSSKVLQLMQASTQFVGLANAITYGWNEKILVQLKKRFGRTSKSSPESYMV